MIGFAGAEGRRMPYKPCAPPFATAVSYWRAVDNPMLTVPLRFGHPAARKDWPLHDRRAQARLPDL